MFLLVSVLFFPVYPTCLKVNFFPPAKPGTSLQSNLGEQYQNFAALFSRMHLMFDAYLFVRGRYTTFSVFPEATQLTGSFLLVPFSSLICLQIIRRTEIDLNIESWPVSQYGSGVRLCSSWHGGGLQEPPLVSHILPRGFPTHSCTKSLYQSITHITGHKLNYLFHTHKLKTDTERVLHLSTITQS